MALTINIKSSKLDHDFVAITHGDETIFIQAYAQDGGAKIFLVFDGPKSFKVLRKKLITKQGESNDSCETGESTR